MTYELKDRLRKIVEEEFIKSWLDTPNSVFGYKSPREMIIHGNHNEIESMISRIEKRYL
jgi:hypothetical protein